eukprot:CAMPEP_0184688364 /NCGR_PEP_ID=MMETSP0312-20130426/29626_1 /TAXON_ID=31354 /ORGANISM="Compsopogon coeruleus, Strain SAG 36.94" /LENGTH=67 /DNA_ID=CAMNT_0027145447 /DNA_START=569 /DNA_END=772 /DNA_ORIENTATION=-
MESAAGTYHVERISSTSSDWITDGNDISRVPRKCHRLRPDDVARHTTSFTLGDDEETSRDSPPPPVT